ncbi:MAG TPA: hypothetical protein VIL51_07510, partial [Thermoleophilia bacterium]
LRQPTVLMAPTLWAEDGWLFLKGALEHGPGTLFEPYSGQIFVFPRIVALLAAPLPVSIQPAIYAAVAVAAAVLSCSIVLSSRWRFSVPLSARFLCLLALLCSPAVGEVFGTLTNAHWWLGIGLVFIGMLSDPLSRRLKLGELAFTALTALSGFAALYAVPSLAVRFFRNRSRHSLALLGVALAGILVQVGYLLNAGRHANGAGMFEHPITEVIVLVRRVFAGSVLGDTNLALLWPKYLPDTWVWLLPIALIVALTAVWIRAPRLEVAALLLTLLGGWAIAMWALTDPLTVLWLFRIGGRYFMVPMAMLYLGLIVSWPTGMLRRGVAGLACVLLATGILTDYHLNPLPYVDWAPFAACVEKHTTTCTTVIPPDWQLEINPPGR